MSQRVLVTGANGQLGWELSRILNPGESVFVDRDALDITDAQAVGQFLREHAFDYVVNCAAYTAVDRAEVEAEACRRINVGGIRNLAQALRGTHTRLIHISTDFVFDGLKETPYVETDAVAPLSVYGKSKTESEKILFDTLPSALVIRTGWLYSAHGHNFVKTMLRVAASGTPLKVVDDQCGKPTWAADLARAIKAIIDSAKWQPGVYHFSNQGETTWYGFAREICDIAYRDAKLSPCTTAEYPTAAKRPAYSVLDKTKITSTYPNVIVPHWRDSLLRCLKEIENTLNHNRINVHTY